MAAPSVLSSGVESATAVTTIDTGSQATQAGDVLCIAANACCFDTPFTTVVQTGATWVYRNGTCLQSAGMAIFESTGGAGSGACTVDNSADNFYELSWIFLRPAAGDVYYDKVGEDGSAGGDFTATITHSGTLGALVGYAYTNTGSSTWAVDSGWTELVDEGTTASHNLQYRITTDAEWIADIDASQVQLGVVLEFVSTGGGGGISLIESKLLKSPLLHSLLVR